MLPIGPTGTGPAHPKFEISISYTRRARKKARSLFLRALKLNRRHDLSLFKMVVVVVAGRVRAPPPRSLLLFFIIPFHLLLLLLLFSLFARVPLLVARASRFYLPRSGARVRPPPPTLPPS